MADCGGSGPDHRVSVLFLSHHLPWPTFSGGRRREAELLRVLAERHDIEVVAITKVPHEDRRGLARASELGLRVRLFAAATAGGPFSSPLVRHHRSVEATRYLSARLATDDGTIVHVEGHYLLPSIPRRAWSRTLLVEHNIESRLRRQRTSVAQRQKVAARLDELTTARTERRAWRGVPLLGALSEEDAGAMRLHAPQTPVTVLPSGADHLHPVGPGPAAPPAPVDVLFVANFQYPPSRHAAQVLVEQILPAVRRAAPRLRLAVVGADPPAWLTAAARRDHRLVVPGWVDDLSAWYAASSVFVCPLWIGGGIKIKMLEAVAAGRCVVTTSIGAQGFPRAVRDALVIRDHPATFAEAVATLLGSAQLRRERQAAVRRAAAALPTWDQSARSLEQCWLRLANR